MTICYCNARTMATATQTGQVAEEMVDYGIEVLEISETQWEGIGLVTLQSGKVVCVGDDEV